jgi:hypothetical protein
VEETQGFVGRRAQAHAIPALTNFYPTYDGANDQVDRVLPVRRTMFQRVIPRYRLSTSETRDQGLGPSFIYSEYEPPGPRSARRDRGPGDEQGPEVAAVSSTDAGSGTRAAAGVAGAPGAALPAPSSRPAPLPAGRGVFVDLFAYPQATC